MINNQNMLKRKHCVICQTTLIGTFKLIPSFPIHMGTTNVDSDSDIFGNQSWAKCSSCGCTQLTELIPLDLLYASNHNDVVGDTWRRHHVEFADFILQSKILSICEIGAAHGFLSNLILLKKNIPYTIVEPTENSYESKVTHIKGFIEDNLNLISSFNSIVHSHVLEHVYDPVNFLKSVADEMLVGSNLFMSFPNIERLIEIDGSNALNFEHTFYLHPSQLDFILSSLNLEIVQKKNFERHSFFYWLKKTDTPSHFTRTELHLPDISHLSSKWLQFWENLAYFTSQVNIKLEANNIPTYLFGAHIFSQTLSALGINSNQIVGVLDNSINKQGQRLYGTPWQVFDPKVISNLKNVQVILKASHYQNEIKIQLQKLNPGVVIFE
jgi:2-polyprenyl-3-methyl-5-hydroxy-6-metoxy-1,4-benzoquinol methylase